ncbi:MAG: PepSY-associated TM helix domain-containing protein [Thermoanaerobaculia bacterium]|nr:PepSY-associated TM helix domain-containing protein [Thermoanaerobaculia bacterium]
MNWRKLNNVLHRDLGYLAAGLTLVYAISGVALNHRHHWNPTWKLHVETKTFEPVPVADRDTMAAALVERLALPGPPKSSFRSAPHLVELFYEGWSVKADATAGTATIERPRGRFALREMNFLHLNEPKGLWTWAADIYAVVLGLLAITGLFVLKGKNGLAGRGKWLTAIGVLLPLVALFFFLGRPGDRGPRGAGVGRGGGEHRVGRASAAAPAEP